MSEVHVQIPTKVNRIISLAQIGSNLGLRIPVLLQLTNGIALINGETGTLYRQFPIPNGVVDCVYISTERCFIIATKDGHLISIPALSSTMSASGSIAIEYPQVSFTLKDIKQLITLPATNELYVLFDGGHLVHTYVKDLKVVVQSSNSSKLKSFSDGKKIEILSLSSNSHYISLLYKDEAKKSSFSFWKTSALSSSQTEYCLIQENAVLNISISTILAIPDGKEVDIFSAVLHDDEDCLSIVYSESSMTSEATWQWSKVQLSEVGNNLFKRVLSKNGFKPDFVTYGSGLLWVLSDCTLSCYSSRFGQKFRSFNNVTNPRINGFSRVYGLVCTETESSAYRLLYGEVTDETLVYRRELGSGLISSAMTLSELLGSKKEPQHQAILDNQVTSGSKRKAGESINSAIPSSFEEAKRKYYKKVSLETNLELLAKGAASADKFSINSHIVPLSDAQTILRQLSADLIPLADSNGKLSSIKTSEWELVKIIIRAKLFSVQQYNNIFQAALYLGRFDVLCDIIRFTADITEMQVIQIISKSVSSDENLLQHLSFVGCSVLWDIIELGKNQKEQDDSDTSKRLLKKSIALDSSFALLRAVVECILHRPQKFSSAIISEAIQAQNLSSSLCANLLRVLSFTLHEICSINTSSSLLMSSCCDSQVDRAVEWIEAVLDGQFAMFAMEAGRDNKDSSSIRSALKTLVEVCCKANSALSLVEQARGYLTEAERVAAIGNKSTNNERYRSSKQGQAHYIIETLELF